MFDVHCVASQAYRQLVRRPKKREMGSKIPCFARIRFRLQFPGRLRRTLEKPYQPSTAMAYCNTRSQPGPIFPVIFFPLAEDGPSIPPAFCPNVAV